MGLCEGEGLGRGKGGLEGEGRIWGRGMLMVGLEGEGGWCHCVDWWLVRGEERSAWCWCL